MLSATLSDAKRLGRFEARSAGKTLAWSGNCLTTAGRLPDPALGGIASSSGGCRIVPEAQTYPDQGPKYTVGFENTSRRAGSAPSLRLTRMGSCQPRLNSFQRFAPLIRPNFSLIVVNQG
jgi:hypothetical protein